MSELRRYMGKAEAMAIPRGATVKYKYLGKGRAVVEYQGKEYITIARLCHRIKEAGANET